MSDEQTPAIPAPAAPDAAAPASAPLDTAPLSEFVARRAKGETPSSTPPAELPEKTPEDGGEEEEFPSDTPADEKKPQPKKSRFEERLGTLTRQRHDAERALQSERDRAARLEAELQALKTPQQPESAAPAFKPGPPVLEDYLTAGQNYEQWMTALIRYENQQTLQQERQRWAQQQQQQEFQQQLSGFGERSQAAQTKYPDYADVVMANDKVILSPVMQDIAVRSEFGPDIMYWLGTHEAEANAIGEQTRHCTRADFPLVEQHLLLLSGHRPNGQPGAKKAVIPSQAPAPLTPVGGGTTTQPVSLDQAPLGDYIKRRQAELSKRRTG